MLGSTKKELVRLLVHKEPLKVGTRPTNAYVDGLLPDGFILFFPRNEATCTMKLKGTEHVPYGAMQATVNGEEFVRASTWEFKVK